MTPFIIMIPLMVLAVAIATIPILYVSLREHNLVRFGNSKRPASVRPVYATRKTVVDSVRLDS